MAIYQDTTYSQSFQVTADGAAVNITDWALSASFRQHVTDEDPLFTLTVGDGFVLTDAVQGQFMMTISQARTLLLPVGHVVFDIMRTDTGEPNRLCGGRVRVKQPVTRL